MISLKNITKFYKTKQGRHYIFDNVSIDLPTDINIGILGPNGAGKSTLVKMIGGADLPNKGEITTDKRISWPLGLQGGLQGSMSGRENVRFVARIHGYKNTTIIEDQVEAFAELGKFYNEPVKTYSSGMRSRITFGLTMAFDFNFDVLLIDELNAVGDANFKKKSEQILVEKYKQTKIIMVNHSLTELRRFCTAGLVLKNQNLIFYPDIEDAIEDYQVTYVK